MPRVSEPTSTAQVEGSGMAVFPEEMLMELKSRPGKGSPECSRL